MNISLISKHRNELMALAMIWVAFYHSFIGFSFKPINFVLETCGYGGADMFMFLSGFGIYFSYKKNSSYKSYIKKRLIRILPYNIIICFIMMFVYNRTIIETLIDMFGLSIFLRGDRTNWYTSFLITMYLLSPLYLNVFKKNQKLTTFITIISVFIICLLVNNFSFTYIWFKIPTYILGIYFAYMYDNEKNINGILCLILSILGWIFMYLLYHYHGNDVPHVYPMVLIIPGLVLFCAYIVDKIKIFNGTLKFLSKYTYQFYLIQSMLMDVLYRHYGELYFGVPLIGFDVFFNIVIMFITLVLSILLVKLTESIIKLMEKGKIVNF